MAARWDALILAVCVFALAGQTLSETKVRFCSVAALFELYKSLQVLENFLLLDVNVRSISKVANATPLEISF